jgi:Matrixin
MRRSLLALFLAFNTLVWVGRVWPYTLQYTDDGAATQLRWPTPTITVAFSPSLNSPSQNIKAGSDVIGAARRALSHWSSVSNVRFVETTTSTDSISPNGGGDGISVITVADTPENRAAFPTPPALVTGRTRVFFDPASGLISEADITINPEMQFSTDGTAGTYDLEATLTHELGHLLGLQHSGVVGATMQPRQPQNGYYTSAFAPRTLSEDDEAGVRAIYGPCYGTGAIAGQISDGAGPLFGAHVWAERIEDGRVYASNISLRNGNYKIDSLPQGTYRVVAEPLDDPVIFSEIAVAAGGYAELAGPQSRFRTTELAASLTVQAGAITPLSATLSSGAQHLNPRNFGVNGALSTTAIEVAAGKSFTVYVGGEGLDQVDPAGVSISSPSFSVDPASFTRIQSSEPYPVISFDVTSLEPAPFGDYSIRLESRAGEIAYISGGISVDNALVAQAEDSIHDHMGGK